MKQLYMSIMTIALMAFVCVGFAACSSDDDNGGGSGDKSLIGTWRKYSSSSQDPNELGYVILEIKADGIMYEHDIDGNLNIIESSTETFKYKTENGHLYTDKLKKDGYRNEWKDEGAYTISGDILQISKDSGSVKRYKKIK